MKWYVMVLKKYATFSGRARRTEYWMFVLFNFLFSIALSLLDKILFGWMSPSWLSYLYALAVFIPSIAVAVRRFHDIGRSGKWLLVFYGASMLATVVLLIAFLQTIIKGGNINDAGIGAIWLAFVCLIVILGLAIWLLVWTCKDSQRGENKYGPNPKGQASFDA